MLFLGLIKHFLRKSNILNIYIGYQLLKTDYEPLQTSMPEAGFEPADYITKWQSPTIRDSGIIFQGNQLGESNIYTYFEIK